MIKKEIVTICICMGVLTSVLPVMMTTNANGNNLIIVDDEGDGDYTSIQEAIDAAHSGDIIRVYSGTYDDVLHPDSIIINKPLTLEGISEEFATGTDTGKPLVDGYNGVKLLVCETDKVTVTGFILGSLTIYYATNVTISNNVLNSVRDHGGEEGIRIIKGENIVISRNALRNHGHALYIDVEARTNIVIHQNNFMNNIRNTKFRISGLRTSGGGSPNATLIAFTENYWGTDYPLWKDDHSYNWGWGFIRYTLFFMLFCHKSLSNFFPNVPKPILGKIQLFDESSSLDMSFLWLLFDRNPAPEPYTI